LQQAGWCRADVLDLHSGGIGSNLGRLTG